MLSRSLSILKHTDKKQGNLFFVWEQTERMFSLQKGRHTMLCVKRRIYEAKTTDAI